MDTKKCSKCGEDLPLNQYYSRGNGKLRSECKNCHKLYVKGKYQERKNLVDDIKARQGCIKCGENRFYVLDFHHKDPSVKEGTVARLTSNRNNIDFISKEIDKCVVLCSNCHREFHYLEEKKQYTIEQYLDNTDLA